MKRPLLLLATACLLSFSPVDATAQNRFRGNQRSQFRSAVQPRGAFTQQRSRQANNRQFTNQRFRPPRSSGVDFNYIENSGNGRGNTVVSNGSSNARVGINVIRNSGNGAGNTVVANNPNARVNVNYIENSGNGTGNTVAAGGGNGLNVNLIRNSGNGRGNVVVTRGGRTLTPPRNLRRW